MLFLTNDNAVPATPAEFAAYCFRLAGRAPAAPVARGEIVLCGRAFAYEYREPGVYWLTRGTGSKREFFATQPSETRAGEILIQRGGSLQFLTLGVDAAGRLVVARGGK